MNQNVIGIVVSGVRDGPLPGARRREQPLASTCPPMSSWSRC
ncbi:MAG: hypothetical protein ACLVL7_10715 [Anaerotruncus massiliensis (ex Togo et al. 2019)]